VNLRVGYVLLEMFPVLTFLRVAANLMPRITAKERLNRLNTSYDCGSTNRLLKLLDPQPNVCLQTSNSPVVKPSHKASDSLRPLRYFAIWREPGAFHCALLRLSTCFRLGVKDHAGARGIFSRLFRFAWGLFTCFRLGVKDHGLAPVAFFRIFSLLFRLARGDTGATLWLNQTLLDISPFVTHNVTNSISRARVTDMTTSRRFAVAVHTLTFLAAEQGKPRKSDEIAASVKTHPVVIRRILCDLASAGLVSCQTGATGGSRLSRPPARITLLDVQRAVEGVDAFGLTSGPVNRRCPVAANINTVLEDVLDQVNTAIEQVLDEITIDQITRRIRICVADKKRGKRKRTIL
jgi:Rrf2 family protein